MPGTGGLHLAPEGVDVGGFVVGLGGYRGEPADARTGRERRDAAAAAFARTKEYFPLGAPSGPKSTPVSTISKYDRGTWSAPTSLRETQLIK